LRPLIPQVFNYWCHLTIWIHSFYGYGFFTSSHCKPIAFLKVHCARLIECF